MHLFSYESYTILRLFLLQDLKLKYLVRVINAGEAIYDAVNNFRSVSRKDTHVIARFISNLLERGKVGSHGINN